MTEKQCEPVEDPEGNIGQGSVPLLVIDMWEHAYCLQYTNLKADYVSSFGNVVNWEDVDRRLDAARFREVRV